MTDEERRKAIEELANSIVNNMSLSEMMAIVVERAKSIAEQKVGGVYVSPKEFNKKNKKPTQRTKALLKEKSILLGKIKASFLIIKNKIKKLFSKKHKSFTTKK